jgi:hypothetical protein
MAVRCGKRTAGEQGLEPEGVAMSFENWLVLASLVVNASLLVYNFRQILRWDRINELLFEICLDAWKMRHGPLARRMIEIYRRESEDAG